MRESWHGTASGYINHRCRCPDCRAANTVYQRGWRQKNRQKYNKYARQYNAVHRDDFKSFRDENPWLYRQKKVGYASAEVKELLQPLIDLNGWNWLAREAKIDDSRIHRLLKHQKFITQEVVEDMMDNLGLTHVLFDGSLTLIPNPHFEPVADDDC